MDKAAEKRRKGRQQQLVEVRDRRRFKEVGAPVPTGKPGRQAPVAATGTLYPNRRVAVKPGVTKVLKDGAHNVKIGGDVLLGRLRGAKIFTLTLEERATCPLDCAFWQSCYGNNMQRADRIEHGPSLEAALRHEVRVLCNKHEIVLIRLHVLGDFYSRDYVNNWWQLLLRYENLFLFGFTAWKPTTQLGALIARMRDTFGLRCSIRNSGLTGRWGSFTIDFPTDRKMIGDALVCPEQHSAMNDTDDKKHCGNCTACWSSDIPIIFVEH